MFCPDYIYTKGIDFSGQSGTRFVARGARFLTEGCLAPFCLINCENVELIGLTVDCVKKPFCRGRVSNVLPMEDGYKKLTVTLDEEDPIASGTPIHLRHMIWDDRNNALLRAQYRNASYLDSFHLRIEANSSQEILLAEGFI